MRIADLLAPENVYPAFSAKSKKQALQDLSRKAAEDVDLDQRTIFDTLLERERLGTTGVGNGVAIPHGRIRELNRIYGMFARVDPPIDFEAIDEQPVDLVFLLLAPENAGADHLKALARISRLLHDQSLCEKIRGIQDKEALYAFFLENDTGNGNDTA